MELFRSKKYLALFSQVLFFIRSSKTFAIFDMKPFSLVLSDFIVSLGYWCSFLVVLTAFKIYRKIISLRITCDIASQKYHNNILSQFGSLAKWVRCVFQILYLFQFQLPAGNFLSFTPFLTVIVTKYGGTEVKEEEEK